MAEERMLRRSEHAKSMEHAYPCDLAAFVAARWGDDIDSWDSRSPVAHEPPLDPLPELSVLEEVLSTCYQASLLREEEQPVVFRLALTKPEVFPPSAFGGIDVWVNNAGTSMWGPFEEIPLPSQARLIELNLLGAINGCHAVLPHLFDRGGRGVIVNVSSIGGRVPMPFAASYSASKFGLAGFTEALRAELAARSGIEVCGVYPAYVDTPTYLNSANYTGRALRPVPPVVPPERVAEKIVSLALRPRRSVRVGSANAVAVPFALAPDTAGRLVGKLAGRFLLRSGPAAATTDGGLWEVVPTGEATVRGGWGMPERARARRAAGLTAVAAFAGLAGASVLLSRRVRRAWPSSGGASR